MQGVHRLASRSRDASPPVTVAQAAADLLRSGVCIWCEQLPAAGGSLLCAHCAVADPGGVLSTGTAQSVTAPLF